MKPVKVVVVLLVVVLLTAFLYQNNTAFLATTVLEVRLPGLEPLSTAPIPLYALILFSIFGAGLVAALFSGVVHFRLRSALRTLQKQNNSLQEELKSLRNLPITEAEVPTSQPTEAVGNESAKKAEEANSG